MGNGQVFLPIDGAKTKPAKTVELSVSWCEKNICVWEIVQKYVTLFKQN